MEPNSQSEIDFERPDEGANERQPTTIGEAIARIREMPLTARDMGARFEALVRRTLPTLPEYEISQVWSFQEWPERERLLGRGAVDLGIDLVAELKQGGYAAIQCKCWEESRTVQSNDIDSFLLDSAPANGREFSFSLILLITTCKIGKNVKIKLANRGGRWLHFFYKHQHDLYSYGSIKKPHIAREKQLEAINRCVEGLANHDRGRLVMACGTGKTFVALRVAEAMSSKTVLFVAPSIALVGQARREWLRHSEEEIECLIVCSDRTSGKYTGKDEEEMSILELDCAVTRHPKVIADFLNRSSDASKMVFCTYHSLNRITEAQREHTAPNLDLTIIDEAHWTTGVVGKSAKADGFTFQDVHFDDNLSSRKRIYMTATPRIYTPTSKKAIEAKGYVVKDMNDETVYGPEFFNLTFRNAVQWRESNGDKLLCDYRVVVLGIREDDVSPEMRNRLISRTEGALPKRIKERDLSEHITRVFGTALALNGEITGPNPDLPGPLRRTIGFCNSVANSKWYASALSDSKVRERTTREMAGERRAMKINAEHLDASSDAVERARALDRLEAATEVGACEVLCNVKLFSEGVDVPSLDAVVFLEPRRSQVDVVQAVGRVMRKAPGKRLGYIIVPVALEEGTGRMWELARSSQGYAAIGQVLRALQSHDGRLAEETARLVLLAEINPDSASPPDPEDSGAEHGSEGSQGGQRALFDLQSVQEGIFARIMESSGLGNPGQANADEIADSVRMAANLLIKNRVAEELATVLEMPWDGERSNERFICTTAALLIANACLLHKRLCGLKHLADLEGLEGLGASADPVQQLRRDWMRILEHDYKPIFAPALTVLNALPDEKESMQAIRCLVQCANTVADSLSDLGYDHAGPLYHRILGTAESDGAFYTKNTAALMLSYLALSKEFTNWGELESVSSLRMMDPACGTGTLLMGALKAAKERVFDALGAEDEVKNARMHRELVENSICGLDINHHAVQLAASNLTLGAPDVNFEHMNLYTMQHGLDEEGKVRAGSLELLASEGDEIPIIAESTKTLGGSRATRVEGDVKGRGFPVRDLDLVIMNPPFSNNEKRGTKYGRTLKRQMVEREKAIKEDIRAHLGQSAANSVDFNSIRTFFTPLADLLLRKERGTLAKVMPITACTSASGLAERRYLARQFHVERLVTCHARRNFSFSENTAIHECLMVCRRAQFPRPSTEIVVLSRMPSNAKEALEVARLIENGNLDGWGSRHQWPAERIENGDWSPVQWFDGELVKAVQSLFDNPLLIPLGERHQVGPSGRRIRDAFERCGVPDSNATAIFYSKGSEVQRTLQGEPDGYGRPKRGKEVQANEYLRQGSHFLVTSRLDTQRGALTGLYSAHLRVGSGWVPIGVEDKSEAKALAVWWNSTLVWLMLLNQRSTKLTWPAWSLEQLREVLVPRPRPESYRVLIDAYERLKAVPLMPMGDTGDQNSRQIIDIAAAAACGLDVEVVEDWRTRISQEPTLSRTQ